MTYPKTYNPNVHDAMTPEEAAIDIVDAQVADGTCPEDSAHLRKVQFMHDIKFTRSAEERRKQKELDDSSSSSG